MANEIERKFIIPHHFQIFNPYIPEQVSFKSIKQAYITQSDGKVVRVRIETGWMGSKGLITIKYKDIQDLRITKEFEYEILLKDAEEIYANCESKIEKNRINLDINGITWEVDYFTGRHQGLVVAEIEFESIQDSENFMCTEYKEVTNDERFSNVNLSKMNDIQIQQLIGELYAN